MSYIIKVTVFIFSLVMLAEEGIRGHVLGDKYKADKHSTLVLYHYKKDVNKPWLTGDFDFPGIISLYLVSVDSRDLYKVKKGDKIELIESLNESDIYKVKLLKDNSRRPFYFLKSEDLKHFKLEEKPSSS